MTRDAIVAGLFEGKNFNDCINKMEPDHLRDDLRMEVITCVLEWPEDKVVGLWQRKELDFYVARVIVNQIQSSSSPFAKKYRQVTVDYHENVAEHKQPLHTDCYEDRETREALEDLALDNINQLYWYDAELLRMYMKLGNYRAIQKATGIPFISCYKNIQKSIALLRKSVQPDRQPVFSKQELLFIQNNQI